MNSVTRNFLIGLVIAVVLGGGIYLYIHKNEVPVVTEVKQPSLDRPYTITAELPEDAQIILRTNVQKITKELQEDPTHFDTWLELAIHYKIAGDYEGAGQVWKYVAAEGPSDVRYVALGNLGDLYMNFIKDYPKAEEYYKQAITLKPNEISFYADMYRLYHYLYKMDTSADREILAQGLVSNPGNKDLLNLQAELEKGK